MRCLSLLLFVRDAFVFCTITAYALLFLSSQIQFNDYFVFAMVRMDLPFYSLSFFAGPVRILCVVSDKDQLILLLRLALFRGVTYFFFL